MSDKEDGFEPKTKLPLSKFRFAAFTSEWIDAVSPTKAKATLWHLNKLADLLIDGPLTLKMLNQWIDDGAEKTMNYLPVRLTLATAIAFNTKGWRYGVYLQYFERRKRAIENQIQMSQN